jgi:hypothetical protein
MMNTNFYSMVDQFCWQHSTPQPVVNWLCPYDRGAGGTANQAPEPNTALHTLLGIPGLKIGTASPMPLTFDQGMIRDNGPLLRLSR